jgi:hypothetical protein
LAEHGDLLVIVPSRGRPQNVARLLKAVHETRRLDTHVWIGADDDDPALAEYEKVFSGLRGPGDKFAAGPRKGLAEWTNHAAGRHADHYPFLASFGDDHLPRTPGWDKALVRAVREMGGTGFSYPHDGVREDIPEAVVLSSDIVRALGWMALPECQHYFIDNCWADLGRHAGCIRYLRAVAVDHISPATGKVPADATYAASSEKISADQEAYAAWRAGRMPADVKVIRELRDRALQPA